MKPLFSPAGEAALETLMQGSPLLAFDFDGTLAPIVERPEQALMPRGWAALLRELADNFPIAVVTGRSVADVAGKLWFEPRFIIGNHGAEDPEGALGTGSINRLDAIRSKFAWLRDQWEPLGIELEDKRYSLALHYRRAPDAEAAQQCIHELLAGDHPGLHLFHGKCVMNIAPSDAPDKANAVISLMKRAGADTALFAGDDINDEPVFERAPADWVTLKVGNDGQPSAARYIVEKQADVGLLLERVAKIARRIRTAD